MNKIGRISRFIALVLLIGLGFSGCASLSSPSAGTDQKKAINSSIAASKAPAAPKAGTTTAVKAGGSSAKEDGKLGAGSRKIWTKPVEFAKDNWISLLIILLICILCIISCKKAKRKIKEPLKQKIVISSIILISLGLIYGVLHFGILRQDGNFSKYIPKQILKPAATKTVETKSTFVYINTTRLNFRAGPSSTHKIIRSLPRNTKLELISDSGTWWKVKYENTEGFVNSKYLRR